MQPDTMRAMVLERLGEPLLLRDLPIPEPQAGNLLIQVEACGVCRTDLHLVDGELPDPRLPIIPGHEIVGRVTEIGVGVEGFSLGQRVGVPWLGHTCGQCSHCLGGQENLCDTARFTGYQIAGGYAEYAVADARFCFPLPDEPDPESMAPWLCAGLIGHRALSMAGNAHTVGLYGFGAAAHILAQVLVFQQRPFFAFTRPDDIEGQRFARELGAEWAGSPEQAPPRMMDAALIFAPAGPLVPIALSHLRKGGTVVCAGIHMSDIPAFPYRLLWGERCVRSVANLTRRDAEEFLYLATHIPVRSHTRPYRLEEANQALRDLRYGAFSGAAVLLPQTS